LWTPCLRLVVQTKVMQVWHVVEVASASVFNHTIVKDPSAGVMGGENVTSAGWQVTLCNPMCHVSSRSSVATLRTAIHLLLTYLLSDSQVFISLVIRGLWWTVSGQVKASDVLTCTNGVSPSHLPVIMASDRPWTTLSTRARVNKIWRWTESTPQSGWWCSHVAGIYSDCSTRDISNQMAAWIWHCVVNWDRGQHLTAV